MSIPWKRALIVGASSGIGETLARKLAQAGTNVAIVARRADKLRALADELNADTKKELVRFYPHDVTHPDEAAALFAQIAQDLGGLDLVIYASGVLYSVGLKEYDTQKDAETIAVNFTGAVAWLNEAARRFEIAGTGTIVGISSVAGDRGRRGLPIYNASKAALNSYLESLRARTARRGVHVVTIKPGYVYTPMTANMGKLPLAISADQAADEILAAAQAGVDIAYVPAKWRFLMGIVKAIPAPLFKRLNV